MFGNLHDADLLLKLSAKLTQSWQRGNIELPYFLSFFLSLGKEW